MFIKRAKTICSTDNIFWIEVKNLRHMFLANGYLNWFFDKTVEKFLKIKAPRLKDRKNVNEEKLFFIVPYFGKSSQLFTEEKSRTQGSRPRPRPRTQKKSEAKDSLSEDRLSRGQRQECSRPRPRTKDGGANVLQKKSLQKFFSGGLQFIVVPRNFDWRRPKPQIT